MIFMGSIFVILLIVVYVFRDWHPLPRLLIPLLIAIALLVLQEPGRRQEYELYTYGIPVKAEVINTLCYSGSMDVRYSFDVKNKPYYGESRDWDCGEIKAGEHLDLVYLSRAPDIHTLAPAPKPSGRGSDFLFALVVYLMTFAVNAIAKADRAQRAK